MAGPLPLSAVPHGFLSSFRDWAAFSTDRLHNHSPANDTLRFPARHHCVPAPNSPKNSASALWNLNRDEGSSRSARTSPGRTLGASV